MAILRARGKGVYGDKMLPSREDKAGMQTRKAIEATRAQAIQAAPPRGQEQAKLPRLP